MVGVVPWLFVPVQSTDDGISQVCQWVLGQDDKVAAIASSATLRECE